MGLNDLYGKVLKGASTVLAKPISQICNLSIKYPAFFPDHKTTK